MMESTNCQEDGKILKLHMDNTFNNTIEYVFLYLINVKILNIFILHSLIKHVKNMFILTQLKDTTHPPTTNIIVTLTLGAVERIITIVPGCNGSRRDRNIPHVNVEIQN